MRLSAETVTRTAHEMGFPEPARLEKTVRLLGILEGIRDHPYLGSRLALKGGTALNLFVLDAPRLSLDIDLNYVGAATRAAMTAERPHVDAALEDVLAGAGFDVRRRATEHADGKWRLSYRNAWDRPARLAVDTNFMHRTPLLPATPRDSCDLGPWRATSIPVVDIHELAAGKLAALLERSTPRDVFDAPHVAAIEGLDPDKLRTTFVAYAAMATKDLREVTADRVAVDLGDLERRLVPLLPTGTVPRGLPLDNYAAALEERCRRVLPLVLPFTPAERAFLDLVRDQDRVDGRLLTDDPELQALINTHPALRWRALSATQRQAIKARLRRTRDNPSRGRGLSL